jgi:branched-chain amino acid transport system substrate-binding protein
VAALGLLLSGCGTRLPNSAFTQLNGGSSTNQDNQLAAGDNGATADTATSVAGPGGAVAGQGGGGGTGQTTPGGGTVAGGGGGGQGAAQNTASDVGVTPTSIKVGNITGLGGPLGPDAFGATLRGLQVYVQAINARGGVNGRKLILDSCDDNQDGSQNLACAQKLVGQDKIFAFVDNNSLATAPSAHYEYTQNVPDLGYPLNNGYYKYPDFFTPYGSWFPRDGKQLGANGSNWNTTEVYHYYKAAIGVSKAAFFFYSEAQSQQAAYLMESQVKAEGMQVVYESGGHNGENLAAPNFDTDVLTMKSSGADGIFDAVDINGNQKICTSMDRYGVSVKAKVSTIEVWSSDVGTPAWSKPCRDSIFISGRSASYADTSIPVVGQYIADYHKYGNGYTQAQWALEGYANGQILVDGIASMGTNPTRAGFIKWMDSLMDYTDHGFYVPTDWQPRPHPGSYKECVTSVQWQDSAGTYVTRGPMNTCYTTTEVPAAFTPDGS